MRRRIRSAAFPVHRHSLPAVALDGVLVALAYYLAFRSASTSGVPPRYDRLLDRTIPVVVVRQPSSCSRCSGSTRRWMRYSSLRDYVRSCTPCVVAMLALVGYRRGLHPVERHARDGRHVAVTSPTRRPRALRAAPARAHRRRALRGARGLRAAAARLPRRGATRARVLIVGAGDGGRLVLREILRNPELGLPPGRLRRRRPAQARRSASSGVKVLGTTDDLPRDPRRGRARRGA